MSQSQVLFQRAKEKMPGGVNSPVRAFASVGGQPRFIKSAKGACLYDADGREYLDFVGSWGPMLLGHNHPHIKEAVQKAVQDGLSFGAATEREVEMAELICSLVPSVEMVRMVNSGTEAVMSALRVARGYTGREKIVKFEGCYHGHCDAMLVKAGSGVMTQGVPDSAGVPKGCAKDTLTARYNDIESVKALFTQNRKEIAAVIVEPVAANMGVVLPEEGFLKELRALCTSEGALLIFDEVITGFRLALGGAQEYYDVLADLTCFGKVIGAGMPVGAYGGKKEIMSYVAPLGTVYQAGTLSGNPVAMAAGLAMLGLLKEDKERYTRINTRSNQLREGLQDIVKDKGYQVSGVGSLSCLFFAKERVCDYESAKRSDTESFARYFTAMLENGIYLAPSQFEAIFMSDAHTEEDIEKMLKAAGNHFLKV